jgi:hypothetical protein
VLEYGYSKEMIHIGVRETMFEVKIIEKICGKLAVNRYEFKHEGDMNVFIEMYKGDKGVIMIHTSKRKAA